MVSETNDEATLCAEAGPDDLPLPGRTFAGRYRIEKLLGSGAMGAVFAAADEQVGERVALKVVIAHENAETLERFRREVRLARRVTHRNAARTYDLGEHGGHHYLTMELIEGESLEARLARQPVLSVAETRDIVLQICAGLSAAHGVGVVHRDLKPANVLIQSDGRVVITDFGVARGLQGDPDLTTDRLALVGTPAYMAPEQVTAQPVDARTDLYALGIMVYEMLAGVRPFTGDSLMAVLTARLTTDPVDPRMHVACSEALASLVIDCLARDPDARPASAELLADRFAAASRDAAVATLVAPGGAQPIESLATATAISPDDRSLAVRPFRYQGPSDEAYLAEALCEELVDVLSMTRGLKVVGTGATAELAQVRDPKKVGEMLGVDAVVEGTLHRAAERVRIVARLIEVRTGFQLWTDRFDGRLEDVFDLQDRVAKRVAEALRVELEQRADSARVPADVVQGYLRARAKARENAMTGESLAEAYDTLQDVLRRAPTFAQALAQAAETAVRRWFIPAPDPGRDWAQEAQRAVDAALIGAPHLADSHTAAARCSVSRGEMAAAVRHLRNALSIAPTSAAAHEYLGFLQCEAGRADEGARHILLAHELNPGNTEHLVVVGRYYALRNRWDDYEALLAKMRGLAGVSQFVVDVLELRVAAWRGDTERFRAIRPSMRLGAPHPAEVMPELLRGVYLGEVDPVAGVARLDVLLGNLTSPRFRSTGRQLAAETLALMGLPTLAMAEFGKALAQGVLIDADWADHCPALASLRDREDFAEARQTVRRAADAIWRA